MPALRGVGSSLLSCDLQHFLIIQRTRITIQAPPRLHLPHQWRARDSSVIDKIIQIHCIIIKGALC
uniref:Uncharacterized protein n=1 Tax=Ciona intestinalis TaxID=7719 RepID=H2XUP9_CIOIN